MLFIPAEIIPLINLFASSFSGSVWILLQNILLGTILCTNKRTVTQVLRVIGLSNEPNFGKYHRVLNRAKWSSLTLSKILFGLLIKLLPASWPIIIAVDETLERRKGKKIKAKGCYRDAVRSTHKKVVTSFGLEWNCMALIVPMPWSKRPWALPFMTVLGPSRKANETAGKKHKTFIDWTIVMLRIISRWMKKRDWILIGDGAYACIHLASSCIANNVTLVSRLRLDACLYDFPPVREEGKRGRPRIKGKRLVSLKSLVDDDSKAWEEKKIFWYGGKTKTLKILSGICLWYKAGELPVMIKWVITIDPTGEHRAEAFFSTNTKLEPEKIVEYFVMRWNIEITFEEVRAHLGVETQRQWSDKAIARTTPLLMGIYSLVCLIADVIKKSVPLAAANTTWYFKGEDLTFSDIIATVRRYLWSKKYFSESNIDDEMIKIKKEQLEELIYRVSAPG